jgi:hypothetical protein
MTFRKIACYKSEDGKHSVRVFRNTDLDEYVARLYPNGVHYEPADTFESDDGDGNAALEAIKGTAQAMLADYVKAEKAGDPLCATLKGRVETTARIMATLSDVLVYLSAETEDQAKRNMYKYTDCGAWIEFDPAGVRIGSIVEGSDAECGTHTLTYPFTAEAYEAAMAEIEAQADELWRAANDEASWRLEGKPVATTARINGMKLVHEATGVEVQIGEEVTDFRGDKATVTGFGTPRSPASEGRVHVKQEGFDCEFYPSVFGLKIVPA